MEHILKINDIDEITKIKKHCDMVLHNNKKTELVKKIVKHFIECQNNYYIDYDELWLDENCFHTYNNVYNEMLKYADEIILPKDILKIIASYFNDDIHLDVFGKLKCIEIEEEECGDYFENEWQFDINEQFTIQVNEYSAKVDEYRLNVILNDGKNKIDNEYNEYWYLLYRDDDLKSFCDSLNGIDVDIVKLLIYHVCYCCVHYVEVNDKFNLYSNRHKRHKW
jgi:hypothetical protein